MRTFHSAYDIDGYPRVAAVVKTVVVATVAVALAAAWATAGPGNGYVPQEQWAAAHRPGVARIELPRVEITGQAADTAQAVAGVSCAKGA